MIFLQQKRNISKAEKILKLILDNKNDQLIPYQSETLNRLFELYFQTKNYDKIFKNFTQYKNIFKAEDNINLKFKFWQGRIALQKENYETADKIFKNLLSHQGNNFSIRYYLALSYYQQNQLDKAYDFFKQVAEKSKNQLAPQARFKVAEVHFIRKEYKQALLQYTKIIYLYSDITGLYEKSLYKLILCFKYLKETNEYNKYLTKLAQDFPMSMYIQELKQDTKINKNNQPTKP